MHQKNLLISATSYLFLALFAYLPLPMLSIALFSITGIYFAARSIIFKESKFGSIMLVLIGIIILAYLLLGVYLRAACGTGGDC